MRPTNENSLGDVIKEMLRKYELENGLWNEKIRVAWDKCVAKPIVQRTISMKFIEGILTVNLNSSVVRKELELLKSDLIISLNTELKQDVITEIKFF
jgi:Dna[CI] antecedent, DciA